MPGVSFTESVSMMFIVAVAGELTCAPVRVMVKAVKPTPVLGFTIGTLISLLTSPLAKVSVLLVEM